MEPAPAKAKPQGRLLVSTQLDAKDELEEVGELGDLDPVRCGWAGRKRPRCHLRYKGGAVASRLASWLAWALRS